MASVSRVARIRQQNALNDSFQEITATAAVQDTPAGSSVVVTFTHTRTSPSNPPEPDVLRLIFRRDDGTTLRTINVTPRSNGTTTHTLHFTDTGDIGGAARAGTLHLDIHAENTTAAVNTNRYLLQTNGTSTPVAAWSVAFSDRGWVRGTTTATISVSNASAGGAQPNLFAYPDSIYHRIVLGAPLYAAQVFTHRVGSVLSATSDSTATQTFDKLWAAAVKKTGGFADAAAAYTADLIVPNSAITGQPSTVLTYSTKEIQADPRITFTRHVQPNNNVLSLALNNAGGNRLNSDIGFFAARVTNARGDGINQAAGTNLGISYSLRDVGNLTVAITETDKATTTQDGQAGWGPLSAWTAGLPGGGWNNTVTFRDAAGVQGTVVHAYTLLAPDPSIRVIIGGGSRSQAGHHFVPGDVWIAAMAPLNFATGRPLDPDSTTDPITEVEFALTRLNAVTNKAQHLDPTSLSWVDTGTGAVTFFSGVRASLLNPAFDPRVFVRTFGATGALTTVDTSTWGEDDIIVLGRLKVRSTPYSGAQQIAVTGPHNGHHVAPQFDPTGLFR